MAYLDRVKDSKAKKAKEYLHSLQGEDANNLKEWVFGKDAKIKKLQDQIEEMSKVFNGIAKYTNRGPTIYGG